jgi:hypothetical protein
MLKIMSVVVSFCISRPFRKVCRWRGRKPLPLVFNKRPRRAQ